ALKNKVEFPRWGWNLFVDLGEQISWELNLTKCWVCGGPLMAEEWPWKGMSLSQVELLKWNQTEGQGTDRPEGWVLSSDTIGEECIWRIG
ncbi:ENR1 protein, partial [Malurus elegans]|nr:ENR1 protein [Malurus elegans]